MRALISAFLLCFVFLAAPSAHAQSGDSLSGAWRGVFTGGGNQPTEFQVNLADFGGRLTGDSTELNPTGSGGSYYFLANIAGARQGAQVRFTKTYDGTGGRSHAVEYAGRVMPGGRRIVGTWSIGSTTGNFEMVR